MRFDPEQIQPADDDHRNAGLFPNPGYLDVQNPSGFFRNRSAWISGLWQRYRDQVSVKRQPNSIRIRSTLHPERFGDVSGVGWCDRMHHMIRQQ